MVEVKFLERKSDYFTGSHHFETAAKENVCDGVALMQVKVG